jgi:sugar lactone lactonase YvrE
VIDDDVAYPEGPLWIGDKLYYVGYGADQVRMWDGSTVSVVWEAAPGDPFTRCGPSSLVQRSNGNLLITCYDTNLLQEITIDGADVATYDTDEEGEPFAGPNDFAKDADGGIYFSASGVFDVAEPIAGKVYYLDTDNVITDAAIGELFHYSNGLALKNNGSQLLVNEHLAKQISVLDVAGPGVLENRQVFKKLSDIAPDPANPDPKMGPDGIKVSPTTGDVYVCQYGASRILVTDGMGVLKHEIEMPYAFVTNVNFGATESTLFVTVETDANNPDWVYSGKLYQVTTSW